MIKYYNIFMSFHYNGIKNSYGVICYKMTNKGLSFLMIKKSTTYCFNEFVLGRYDKYNELHLINLFNGMTYYEKMDIISMKFANMWYRIYKETFDNGCISQNITSFLKKKNKFDSCFMQDNGKYLYQLISRSQNHIDTPWEFPRGRKGMAKELDLDVAIREFHEETGIDNRYYEIKYHINTYVVSYKDYGIIYKSTYYFAKLTDEYIPVYKFDVFSQVSEVSAVKWIDICDILALDINDTIKQRMTKQFNIIKKIIKNHTKLKIYKMYNMKQSNEQSNEQSNDNSKCKD